MSDGKRTCKSPTSRNSYCGPGPRSGASAQRRHPGTATTSPCEYTNEWRLCPDYFLVELAGRRVNCRWEKCVDCRKRETLRSRAGMNMDACQWLLRARPPSATSFEADSLRSPISTDAGCPFTRISCSVSAFSPAAVKPPRIIPALRLLINST